MAETRFRELLKQTIPINTNHDQTVASSDVHKALTAAAQPFDDATNDIRDLFQTAITESDDINFIKTRIQSFEGRCLQPSDVEALLQRLIIEQHQHSSCNNLIKAFVINYCT